MSCQTELREWYRNYLAIFRLGRGESFRVEELAAFCIPVPRRFGQRTRCFYGYSDSHPRAECENGTAARGGHANSDIVNFAVRSLNVRTTLIEGAFSRRNRHGHKLAKIGVVYLVIKIDGNWRFASLTVVSPVAGAGAERGI